MKLKKLTNLLLILFLLSFSISLHAQNALRQGGPSIQGRPETPTVNTPTPPADPADPSDPKGEGTPAEPTAEETTQVEEAPQYQQRIQIYPYYYNEEYRPAIRSFQKTPEIVTTEPPKDEKKGVNETPTDEKKIVKEAPAPEKKEVEQPKPQPKPEEKKITQQPKPEEKVVEQPKEIVTMPKPEEKIVTEPPAEKKIVQQPEPEEKIVEEKKIVEEPKTDSPYPAYQEQPEAPQTYPETPQTGPEMVHETEPTLEEPVTPSAPYLCNSQIFDCEKTCSIWSPYKNIMGSTALYPEIYEKEWLVLSGENNGQVGLTFQTSLQMSQQCNFSFDSCSLPTTAWEHITSGQLNDAEWNDIVGVTQTKEYFVLYNFDSLMQQKADPCYLTPQPLVEGLTLERMIGEQTGSISKIHTLKSNKFNNERTQNLIAAVEVSLNSAPRQRSFQKQGAAETPNAFVAQSSALGLDIFHCDVGRCEQTFVPVKNLSPGERLQSVQLYFPDQDLENPAMLSVILSMDEGVEWFDCAQNGTWECTLSQTLEKNPLIVVDRAEVKRRAGLKQQEGDRGRKILITEDGDVGDLNFVDQEEEELAAHHRSHRFEALGRVEQGAPEESFNPQAAIDGWFQPDAYNLYVTEEGVIRGNVFAFDENEQIRVESLQSETLNANAPLNNIYSDGVIQIKTPKLPLDYFRKNFGGKDMVAVWGVFDTQTKEHEGSLISVYYNKNETPEVTLETPQKENCIFRFAVSALDVMNDALHCHATLRDQAGNDWSSRIQKVDCNILELDLCPLMDAGEEASASVAKTSLNASINTVSWPLEGMVWATDPGDAQGSASFSLSKSGSVTSGAPLETPVATGDDEETQGSPGFKTRGGGLCGATLTAQGNTLTFTELGIFLLLIFPFSLLIPLRSKAELLRGGRGSNPRPPT